MAGFPGTRQARSPSERTPGVVVHAGPSGGMVSGGCLVLAEERGDVVGAEAEGLELAEVVADLAVAADLDVGVPVTTAPGTTLGRPVC